MIEFCHGVASGDPTSDGIVLWTKLDGANGSVSVRCRVYATGMDDLVEDVEPGAEDLVVEIVTTAETDRGHTVSLEVGGLRPGAAYRFRFDADDSSSPVGRFRTLPDDPDEIRFAVVSCAKYNAGYFNVYRHLASRSDLDFIIHAGDYIYEAANAPPSSQTPGADIGRSFEPLEECRTLDQYRSRYAQYRRDPDLQAMHARHAIIAVLDDHELADNAWEHGAQEHRDAEHGSWSARLHDALTAWEEWMPSRSRPASRADSIHRNLDVGTLANVVLLETRLRRSAPDTVEPDRTQIGPAQESWLRDLVSDGTSDWLVLVSPSAMTPLWSQTMEDEAYEGLAALKITDPAGRGPFFDGWDAYAEERRRILGCLRSSSSSCVVVSGDIHVALAADLRLEGTPVAREWTTASVTSQNLDDKRGWQRRTQSLRVEASIRRSFDHLRYCNLDDHGYMCVSVSRSRAVCEWWFVDTVLEPTGAAHLGHRDELPVAHRATVASRVGSWDLPLPIDPAGATVEPHPGGTA